MLRELPALIVFGQVVQAGSLTGAAKRLGVTKSAVSKQLAALETDLGVQLLVRSTRRLALTEVGERVYESSLHIAEDVERAREAAQVSRSAVAGVLRVAAPLALGRRYVVPLAAELLAKHSELRIELMLSDGLADLIRERIDVAVRVGKLTTATLVARKVAQTCVLVCGSPAYLEDHGEPRTPRDLDRHAFVRHRFVDARSIELQRGRSKQQVALRGRLACDDGPATVSAAIAGVGLLVVPEFEVAEEILAGKLRRVLRDWQAAPMDVHLVFPPRKHVSTRARVFVDLVTRSFNPPPWRT